MRPPICAVCGKESMEKGEMSLISFKKTKSDKKWERKSKQKGFVGHPPWKEWFCKEHAEYARKLSHLSVGKVIEKLNKQFGQKES